MRVTISRFLILLLSLTMLLVLGCKAKKATTTDIQVSFKSGKMAIPASLTLPAKKATHKLPAFILVHGSGPQDRDQTQKMANITLRPFYELAHRLAAKNAAVLRYDKRSFIMKKNRLPFNKLLPDHFINDARAAYNFLKKQPEVDPSQIYIIGHSQGASFAPIIAKNLKVKKTFMIAPAILPIDKLIIYQLKYQINHIRSVPNSSKYRGVITQLKGYIQKFQEGFRKIEDDSLPEEKFILGAPRKFWKRWIELSKDMDSVITNYKGPLVILQGKKDLKCPAHLLEAKAPRYKQKSNIKIYFLKAMRHDMYDFVTGGFMAQLVNRIWSNR